ncbi:putative hydrolase [Colletotrichum tanaceti]|uniref:Putative hydrolase n=1 Tax=Colletotrichum tanaceti TaxID=1306861 RepID=A0A4U6XBV5_9PEZI|nr:putative hydrolase [Colletotrichum tanaceti]TKW52629.1 putative hydrolase [Colletotrichum tanaceti]
MKPSGSRSQRVGFRNVAFFQRATPTTCIVLILAGITSVVLYYTLFLNEGQLCATIFDPPTTTPYGRFPKPDNPLRFIPCTNITVPPPLDDPTPQRTWAALLDPDPRNWNWGKPVRDGAHGLDAGDPYAGRAIHLCGFLDLPLDYTNASDRRIVRLAVNKFQVSGLQPLQPRSPLRFSPVGVSKPAPGQKSERTIIIEPGGPGSSGTRQVWQAAEGLTERFSNGQYDVLGWDPRGVNMSLPSLTCFPHDAYRDRWRLLKGQYRETLADPMDHLRTLDAMNNATFQSCYKMHGDVGRFLSTSVVAHDLDRIRDRLGEDELTGYFVSYGTAIGQTYANMFPDRVDRLSLDGTEYVRKYRKLGGFASGSLASVTDAWRDGFLRECLNAGPSNCALAKRTLAGVTSLAVDELETRLKRLFRSLIAQPVPGYTEESGPAIITYSQIMFVLYVTLYDPKRWPQTAQLLSDLEVGNTTLAASFLDRLWYHAPDPSPTARPSSTELVSLVVCADASDSPQPLGGLVWWDHFWKNMTEESWISGSLQLPYVFQCRHFSTYWPDPTGLYRGDLNHTLRNPVVVISGTHDPATPLSNARDLVQEMGQNARLVVHHGYGHVSREDISNCTDAIGKAYILNGTVPETLETHCYANEKPYTVEDPNRVSLGTDRAHDGV